MGMTGWIRRRLVRSVAGRVALLGSLLIGGAGIVRSADTRAAMSAAGSSWIVESTIGGSVAVNDAAFINEQNGWVAGDGGTLYYTHNGGLNWGRYTTNSGDNLKHIHFFDPQNGYAVGGNTLLHTTDGGAHWHAVLSDSLPSKLQDMTETDANTLWAVASDGIYQSTDAGQSWGKVYAGAEFAQISAPTPTDIWIVGYPGIYHTADAGNSWAPVTVDSNNGTADTVSFGSATLGFVAGTFQPPDDPRPALYIARTTDGGTTWGELSGKTLPLLSADVKSIHGVGPSVMLAYSWTDDSGRDSGAIVASNDAGSHWTSQALPDGTGALMAAGYRGFVPWALTHDGSFLHFGPIPKIAAPPPVPQPSATQAAPPTAAPTAAATNSPTAPAVVTFAAQPVAPTATATPDLLHLHSVSPRTVVQGSGATITVLGSNMDPNATISIGDNDITNAHHVSTGLRFSLPPEVSAGKFDVQVTNPDGTIGVLHKALTVLTKLTISAVPDHAAVGPGFSLELTVDSIPGASLRAVVHTANGHPAPHIVASLHQQSPGEWRVSLAVGSHVPLGPYVAVFTAAAGSQRATISLRFQVTDMVGASL